MNSGPRRTQAQRREATIGKLLQATVTVLAERGYAGASVAAISKHAGVSQGGLFRHFDSRQALVAAAIEAVAEAHIARFERALPGPVPRDRDALRSYVQFIRTAARTDEHAAWQAVFVAARADAELRQAVREPLMRFEHALLGLVAKAFGVTDHAADRLGMVVLTFMHAFDSEAVTTATYPNPSLEAARVEWMVDALATELRQTAPRPIET